MPGFTVPEGENRVLLVAVGHAEGTIGSVTFGGQPLSQVGALINDETGVALFELREAQLGPGAQTADLEVDFLGYADTEVTAFTVTGVDQAAAPAIAQAAQPLVASSIGANITTGADTAILVSAVGLGDSAIWSPGAGETEIGYAETGGASYEVVAAGSHDMSWSGSIAQTPTLLVAAYPAAETGGGSSIERTIAWSSFNKPTLITEVSSGNEAGFTYGPDRARIKQHVVEGGAARDVVYAGSLYERRIQLGSPDELVHYVVAGGTVAIHTVFDDNLPATNRTRYLHRDHLGSIEAITGETGAVVQRLSFDAHGQRRLADWTAGAPAAPDAETPRGFTGHEHLDSVGLIHMNGRVYDPTLGRFLSADPFVPNPTATQAFNRYSYVGNNPLSYTDPSGFFFKKIKKAFKKAFKKVGKAISKAFNAVDNAVKSAAKAFFSLPDPFGIRDFFLTNPIGQALGMAFFSYFGPWGAAFFAGMVTLRAGRGLMDTLMAAGTAYAISDALRQFSGGLYAGMGASQGGGGEIGYKVLAAAAHGAIFAAQSEFKEEADSGSNRRSPRETQLASTAGDEQLAQTSSEGGSFGYINLLDHEGIEGAHTIRDHVGKSDRFLREQLAVVRYEIGPFNIGIAKPKHSTFSSLTSANSLVSSTLAQSAPQIAAWLASGEDRLTVSARFVSPTGRQAFRPGGQIQARKPGLVRFRTTFGVSVHIRKSDLFPYGFRVHTAFPAE